MDSSPVRKPTCFCNAYDLEFFADNCLMEFEIFLLMGSVFPTLFFISIDFNSSKLFIYFCCVVKIPQILKISFEILLHYLIRLKQFSDSGTFNTF